MKKEPDAEPDAQPCLSADYLRSYPVDCSRRFIHLIEPGDIVPFAGQGGVDISGSKETMWLGRFVRHNRDIDHDRDRGGRPSSRVLVRDETMRRLVKGEYLETLKEFCEQLSKWLADREQMTMEKIPQMTPPVVERNINDLWNEFHSCRRDCHPTPWR